MTVKCVFCEGQGWEEGICGTCNGSGEGMADGTTCFHCKGSGAESSECEHCKGVGELETFTVEFAVDAAGRCYQVIDGEMDDTVSEEVER